MLISFRTSLEKDAPNYFDPETGVLELPLFIRVADQVLLLLIQKMKNSTNFIILNL